MKTIFRLPLAVLALLLTVLPAGCSLTSNEETHIYQTGLYEASGSLAAFSQAEDALNRMTGGQHQQQFIITGTDRKDCDIQALAEWEKIQSRLDLNELNRIEGSYTYGMKGDHDGSGDSDTYIGSVSFGTERR